MQKLGAIFMVLSAIGWGVAELGKTVSAAAASNDPNQASIQGAKQVLETFLKAPASAKYPEVKILSRSGKHVLADVTVDSQNQFGAMIRGRYFVAFTENDPAPGDLKWSKEYGVQEYMEDPDILSTMKTVNDWGN